MTQDEIIEMAEQAGFDCYGKQITWDDVICTNELKAFAKLVAAKAVAKERKEAWEAVNVLIVLGHIGGNVTDLTAQQNGLVIASNVLMRRIDRGQA
jgi:2',3'-cyclic-nucleotide 2'-phosphodiesterase (5'-nucleotidase family)